MSRRCVGPEKESVSVTLGGHSLNVSYVSKITIPSYDFEILQFTIGVHYFPPTSILVWYVHD